MAAGQGDHGGAFPMSALTVTGAVEGVLEAAAAAGLAPRGLARSGLPGQDGNVEFFLHLRCTDAPASAVLEDVPGHADVDWA